MPGPGPVAALLVLLAAAGGLLAARVPEHAAAPIVVLVPQGVLIAVLVLAMLVGRWRPRDCGLGGCTRRQLAAGLLLAPLLVVVANGVHTVVVHVLGEPPAAVLHVDDIISRLYHQGGWATLILLAGVLPGMAEEALLRGVVLSGLRRRLSAPAAVTVTALAFAALHMSPWRFFPQLILGLVAGMLAVRTGSCWPAAAMHALYNAQIVALAVVYPPRT